ncbi:hypothetical protein [Providencia rustigianii]|uniref:hypothetical protein n=1 Tax=Providencia rustigianii TaxID=158850 RepID=UPI002244F334|nr:hypothetical protein [Providencia rustigianii]
MNIENFRVGFERISICLMVVLPFMSLKNIYFSDWMEGVLLVIFTIIIIAIFTQAILWVLYGFKGMRFKPKINLIKYLNYNRGE